MMDGGGWWGSHFFDGHTLVSVCVQVSVVPARVGHIVNPINASCSSSTNTAKPQSSSLDNGITLNQ